MRSMNKSKNITEIANTEKLPLQAIQLNIDSDKSVEDAINRIMREKDRIDVIVNNAGYVLAGAILGICCSNTATVKCSGLDQTLDNCSYKIVLYKLDGFSNGRDDEPNH